MRKSKDTICFYKAKSIQCKRLNSKIVFFLHFSVLKSLSFDSSILKMILLGKTKFQDVCYYF